jgi:uncharacterized membrane protein
MEAMKRVSLGLVLAFAAAGLIGCSETEGAGVAEENGMAADDQTDESSLASGPRFVRGLMSLAEVDAYYLEICGGETISLESLGETLQPAVELLGPMETVYVEGFDDPNTEAPLDQLTYASPEHQGCEGAEPDYLIRLSGNEPFWGLTVDLEETRFEALGGEEIVLETSEVVPDGMVFFALEEQEPDEVFDLPVHSMNYNRQDLYLYHGVMAFDCYDTMSGAYHSHEAEVTIDETEYEGCARLGPQLVRALENAEQE